MAQVSTEKLEVASTVSSAISQDLTPSTSRASSRGRVTFRSGSPPPKPPRDTTRSGSPPKPEASKGSKRTSQREKKSKEEMPVAQLNIPPTIFGAPKQVAVYQGKVQDSLRYSVVVDDEPLGKGRIGIVRLAMKRRKEPGDLVPHDKRAVKTVYMSRDVKVVSIGVEVYIHNRASQAQRDLSALQPPVLTPPSQPLVVKLYDIFVDAQEISIVMENLGSNAFDYLWSCKGAPLEKARRWAGELASALHFLHNKQHIAHRDVKSENIMLDRDDDPEHIRLGDFGFAAPCRDSHSLCNKTFCGTTGFMPPEMLVTSEGPLAYNGQMADMWSSGVVTLEMYGVFNPFGDTEEVLSICRNIVDKDFTPRMPSAAGVLPDDLEFIQRLLTRPVAERLTSAEAVQQPIFHLASPGGAAKGSLREQTAS